MLKQGGPSSDSKAHWKITEVAKSVAGKKGVQPWLSGSEPGPEPPGVSFQPACFWGLTPPLTTKRALSCTERVGKDTTLRCLFSWLQDMCATRNGIHRIHRAPSQISRPGTSPKNARTKSPRGLSRSETPTQPKIPKNTKHPNIQIPKPPDTQTPNLRKPKHKKTSRHRNPETRIRTPPSPTQRTKNSVEGFVKIGRKKKT